MGLLYLFSTMVMNILSFIYLYYLRFRAIANAPSYVTDSTLRVDLNVSYVSEVIQEGINKHHNPEAHPSALSQPPLQPTHTRRLKDAGG
jgi:hypothetical protein